MSKISIAVENPSQDKAVLMFLYKLLKHPLNILKEKLAAGPDSPFYETELYMNDYEERHAEIRQIISWFDAQGITLAVAEIPYDMSWEDVEDPSDYQISTEELINMLDAFEDELHTQEEFSVREITT